MTLESKIVYSQNLCSDVRPLFGGLAPEQIFIITDSGSNKCCLGVLLSALPELKGARVIMLKEGDENKNLDAVISIWRFLVENGATRSSLVINLGGGMVTDLGGFAASTFKRGVRFINIPTTLLSMIDAATGGKTGFNFKGLKNEIGVINKASEVIIYPTYLQTLTKEELLSGYAEMIKHALLSSENDLMELLSSAPSHIEPEMWLEIIRKSLQVKENIVAVDPMEKGIRKALNLGHTVGHAFESFSHQSASLGGGKPLSHGHAVAFGLAVELFLSYKHNGLDNRLLSTVNSYIKEHYGTYSIGCDDYESLYALMLHDKKNSAIGAVNFTLLSKPGSPEINRTLTKEQIFEALDYFRDAL